MLVVALGLPRFFVLCSAGGDALHLEFAHAPGACCEPSDERRGDGSTTPGGEWTPAPASCEHVELAIELAPAPRGGDVESTTTPTLLAVTPLPLPGAFADAVTNARPPATGPPPWRDRLRQQASVRLQV